METIKISKDPAPLQIKNEHQNIKIEPLFSTGIASLSQIEGQIEVLYFIIDKYSSNSINILL